YQFDEKDGIGVTAVMHIITAVSYKLMLFGLLKDDVVNLILLGHNMVRNVDNPTKFLMYPWFLQVIINAQVDDLCSYNNQYTSPILTQKVFANMYIVEEEYEVEVPNTPTPPFSTTAPSSLPQDPIPIPPQAQPATPSPPPQEQQLETFESSMTLLNTLMATGKIKAIDADEMITKDDDNAAIKDVNTAEPTVFDDEELP
nr:hypothetical protein [Tanacetum cinerariifolium]